MHIALLSSDWGPVNLLRQTNYFSGVSSNAHFHINKSNYCRCDFALTTDESNLKDVLEFPHSRRVFICMENPQIWSPSLSFLSNFGFIFTPFPDFINQLSPHCRIINSYPCVPWFYDIDFSISAGLIHVPLHSRSDLSAMLSFRFPRKTKLLSIVLSSKANADGYSWRLQLAYALKSYFGDLVDIFGFGHNPLPNKKDAFVDYLATVVFENSSHPYYITEKLPDAVLGWSMPIYCGSESFTQLFPEYRWSLPFGSDVSTCLILVKQFIHEILSDSHTLEYIRPTILRRLNLFDEIPSHLNTI